MGTEKSSRTAVCAEASASSIGPSWGSQSWLQAGFLARLLDMDGISGDSRNDPCPTRCRRNSGRAESPHCGRLPAHGTANCVLGKARAQGRLKSRPASQHWLPTWQPDCLPLHPDFAPCLSVFIRGQNLAVECACKCATDSSAATDNSPGARPRKRASAGTRRHRDRDPGGSVEEPGGAGASLLLDLTGAIEQAHRYSEKGRHHRGGDVRSGKARQDLFVHRARLAAGQTAGFLPSKNTDGLIGGVVKVLEDEGIHLSDSTALLKPMLATEGAMTKRKPEKDETSISSMAAASATRSRASMWGRAPPFASALASRWKRWKAPTPCCAALPAGEWAATSLVKVARRRDHLLFDVPVAWG